MNSGVERASTPVDASARGHRGRAVVMGLGSFGGGVGAARYLAGSGWSVVATDLRPAEALRDASDELTGLGVRTVLGEHRARDFEEADLVVANPAVALDHSLLEVARRSGARVTSEIELFLEAVRARLVCVTGTQGKSSTCHLIAGLLAHTGRRCHLGGNIGVSLLSALPGMGRDDVCVLELSSYQLEALADPEGLGSRLERVELVAVTNVLADHLERHGTRARYAEAKRRILDLLGDGGHALIPGDDPELADWAPRRGERIAFSTAGREDRLALVGDAFRFDGEALAPASHLRLPGTFQRANALLALGAARLLGVPAVELAAALPKIGGLPHRLEDLGRFRGHQVIDNGVSTTPDSTVAALRSVDPGCVILLGGRRKDLPLDELIRVARERVALAVLFGESRAELGASLRSAGVSTLEVETVAAALEAALERSPEGAPVLFSPACASFDAYPNFQARADAFRRALTREEEP